MLRSNLLCLNATCPEWSLFLFLTQKGPHRCRDSGHICQVRSRRRSGADGARPPADERRPGERESEWWSQQLVRNKWKNTAHPVWWRTQPHTTCRRSVCFCSYARRTWIWNAIRWLDPAAGGASLAPRTTRRRTTTRTAATALVAAAAARVASPMRSFKCKQIMTYSTHRCWFVI